jgi:GNAT superfamily N-acetyltransferase
MELTVRIFPEIDRGRILHREYLLREVNKGIWDRLKYFMPEFYHQQTNICLIDSNKKILAVTGLQQNIGDHSEIYTTFITTDPEYRGRGLARRLVRERFEYMRKFHPGKTLKISSYTSLGFLFVKPMIDQISKEYPDVQVTESGFRGLERTLNNLREELAKNGKIDSLAVPVM